MNSLKFVWESIGFALKALPPLLISLSLVSGKPLSRLGWKGAFIWRPEALEHEKAFSLCPLLPDAGHSWAGPRP